MLIIRESKKEHMKINEILLNNTVILASDVRYLTYDTFHIHNYFGSDTKS